MSNQAARIAALATAALLVVACLAFVAVLAVSGHLDATTGPYVVSAFGVITTAVPALVAVATTQETQARVDQIRGLVNGNYSQAMRALADIARSHPNPDVSLAGAALTRKPSPPPPAAG